jgi:hypothetical protein
MLYALFRGDRLVGIAPETPFTGTPKLKEFPGMVYDRVEDHWDWKKKGPEYVEGLALKLTEITGRTFLACTTGDPDIFEPPAIGDKVSYAFNGDYTPCGVVTKITKGWRITTSEGKVFNRHKKSGGWMMVGGTWRLVGGHIDERNPSF